MDHVMIEFLVVSLVVVASPGPGAMFTIATTASRGMRAGWVAAVGCTLGVAPHLLIASTGLAALVRPGTAAFDVVRYAGAAYLLVLAVQAWRDHTPLNPAGRSAASPASPVLRRAITMNLLNPKLTAFFMALLPQFAAGSSRGAGQTMALLGLAFMMVTFVVFVGYASLTHRAQGIVAQRAGGRRWFGRLVGTTYVALAGRLAMT